MRVGIVGCGNIAGNHVTAFRAADTEVVACCDVAAGRAAAFAARHGVPTSVSTVDALLDLGVDVVSVCTPHPTHEAVVTAARLGARTCSARSRSRSTWPRPGG